MKGASPRRQPSSSGEAGGTGSAPAIPIPTRPSGACAHEVPAEVRWALPRRQSTVDERSTRVRSPTCVTTCSSARVSCNRSYFYDALGSQLFEAICQLPWYRIPSAERALLGASRRDDRRRVARSDDARRARVRQRRQAGAPGRGMRRARPMLVRLVDISPTALELSARTLGSLSQVSVVGHRAPFGPGLRDAGGAPSGAGLDAGACSSAPTSATSIPRRRPRFCARCARACGPATVSCSVPTW